MTVTEALDVGNRLATLGEPGKTLADFVTDLREVATTLQMLADGAEHAEEQADTTFYDRTDALWAGWLWKLPEGLLWTRDEIEMARDNEMRAARDTALRTAKRALVDLARVVGEMETHRHLASAA